MVLQAVHPAPRRSHPHRDPAWGRGFHETPRVPEGKFTWQQNCNLVYDIIKMCSESLESILSFQKGDVVECSIDGIGTVKNTVV